MRYSLWPGDVEDQSLNYRELKNLVDTVEEESKAGYLQGLELWLFTDNSTAESCFHKGGLLSGHLHDLVPRLRKLELDARFTLYVVHVAGTRMIAQGIDGLSRGVLLEGVMAGEYMLSYIPLAKGAVQRQPNLADYVNDWVGGVLHQKVEASRWKNGFKRGTGSWEDTRGHTMCGCLITLRTAELIFGPPLQSLQMWPLKNV